MVEGFTVCVDEWESSCGEGALTDRVVQVSGVKVLLSQSDVVNIQEVIATAD
jgi:hypothetical protein